MVKVGFQRLLDDDLNAPGKVQLIVSQQSVPVAC